MAQVNLYDAKTQLSRLVPLAVRTRPRELGFLGDEVWVGPDFDAPLPNDLQRAFAGEGP